MHKLNENYKVVNLLPLQAIASATTTEGTGVDCIDCAADCEAIVTLGAMTGTHTCDVKMQESAALATGYADITGATFTQTSEASDNKFAAIGFKRTKRYVRAVVVTAGTVTANDIAIVGLVKVNEGKTGLNSATAA